MKRNAILLLILASICPLSQASDNGTGRRLKQNMALKQYVQRSKQPLRLTAKILRQTYCDEVDGEVTSLRMLLLLTFRNLTHGTIFLERGGSSVHYIKISKTPEAARSRNYEDVIHTQAIGANENPKLLPQDHPTTDALVILPSGASYGTTVSVSIVVPKGGAVSPGRHYLQVTISTWSGTKENAEAAYKKWQSRGRLWFKELTSEITGFTIEPLPDLDEDCECRNSGISRDAAIAIANKNAEQTLGSVTPYNLVAYKNMCEWNVIYDAKDKKSRRSHRYVIDAKTARILHSENKD